MGSKPWLIAGAFAALSTLIVGCNSGPQRDTRVLGASNGNPPSMNANGGMPQFPKMDANASAGQPRNGLPSIGATPGNNSFAPASNNSFAPTNNNAFAPTSNRALPANTPFSPLDRGNPSLPNSNPGPNFPSSGVTVPNNTVNPGPSNLAPHNPVPVNNGGFGVDRPGVPAPLDLPRN